MKTKWWIKAVFISVVSILWLPFVIPIVYVGLTWSGESELTPKVNVRAIRQIRIGMSQAEVEAILGEPFSTEKKDEYYYGTNAYVMRYSKPVQLARWFPMLWVHLKNGKVEEVYAKRYILWGVDDEGVYGLDVDRHWEATSFKETFPN
jgi:SmpA / OmlA family